MGWIRLNVLLIYLFGIGLVISTVVVIEGVGVGRAHECYAAIMVCAFFYLGAKIFMYIFLVCHWKHDQLISFPARLQDTDKLKIERAHVIAAPYRTRFKDTLWVVNVTLLVAGFIAVGVLVFGWPIAIVSRSDGKCRIGFPLHTSLTMLVWDIGMNALLTGVFVYMLYPFLTYPTTQLDSEKDGYCRRFICRIFGRCRCQAQNSVTGKLQRLLRRTTLGGTLMMLATIANIIVLVRMQGHQQVWLCLIMCPLDSTFPNHLTPLI
jgi:hypothetical protein